MNQQKNSTRKKSKIQLEEYLFSESKEKAMSLVADLFLSTTIYHKAQVLLAYAATDKELSVDMIIQAAQKDGKQVALPRTNPSTGKMEFHYLRNDTDYQQQLLHGNYGIREPKSNLPIVQTNPFPKKAAVIVPGLAFTIEGHRLGHGKGYYDRYLTFVLNHNKKDNLPSAIIGVCFDFQVVKKIPVEKHDIPMTHLLTPSGIVECHMN